MAELFEEQPLGGVGFQRSRLHHHLLLRAWTETQPAINFRVLSLNLAGKKFQVARDGIDQLPGNSNQDRCHENVGGLA